jgi:dGTPase
MHEVVRMLIHHLVTGLIAGTSEACADIRTVEDVRNAAMRVCRFSEVAGTTDRELKAFLRLHVYQSETLVEERQAAMSRIADLFQLFLAKPETLPAPYHQNGDDPLHRVICDYLAGMTDGFLNRTWAQLSVNG